MIYKIYLESEDVTSEGIKSKISYNTIISKNKFDKIYSILKNEDN